MTDLATITAVTATDRQVVARLNAGDYLGLRGRNPAGQTFRFP
jgi:hypothetical protein